MPRAKRPMTVSPEEFDAWIQEALTELPTRFAKLADEVSIVVEEGLRLISCGILSWNQRTICWVCIKASR
jgi:hypothetical protein